MSIVQERVQRAILVASQERRVVSFAGRVVQLSRCLFFCESSSRVIEPTSKLSCPTGPCRSELSSENRSGRPKISRQSQVTVLVPEGCLRTCVLLEVRGHPCDTRDWQNADLLKIPPDLVSYTSQLIGIPNSILCISPLSGTEPCVRRTTGSDKR
jgi:hypothetical protein